MSAAVKDIVDLSFRDDLGLLFSRWLRRVNDAEVRQGYEAALAVAEPRRARYWLLDLRRRGLVSQSATRWVIEGFLPRMTERLGGDVYLAYLLSPSHLAEAPKGNEAPIELAAHCTTKLFTDEHSALLWLNECRCIHSASPSGSTPKA